MNQARILGVIGYPIGHSLSPLLHEIFGKHTGEKIYYAPYPVKENLALAIQGAWHLGFCGLNVTIPYKTQVIPELAEVDETAGSIGAVNTLVRSEGGFTGYNTDIYGIGALVKSQGIEIKNRPVCILGAGGAAKSVVHMCGQEGAFSLCIVNRDADRARALQRESKRFFSMPIDVCSLEEVRRDVSRLPEGLVVFQTTSVGMYPHREDCIISDPAFFEKMAAGVDLVYTPLETAFLRRCRAAGKPGISGLGMLIYQGARAFSLWTGKEIPPQGLEEARVRLEEALRNS